jgi:hypothetical protein
LIPAALAGKISWKKGIFDLKSAAWAPIIKQPYLDATDPSTAGLGITAGPLHNTM